MCPAEEPKVAVCRLLLLWGSDKALLSWDRSPTEKGNATLLPTEKGNAIPALHNLSFTPEEDDKSG